MAAVPRSVAVSRGILAELLVLLPRGELIYLFFLLFLYRGLYIESGGTALVNEPTVLPPQPDSRVNPAEDKASQALKILGFERREQASSFEKKVVFSFSYFSHTKMHQ